MVTVGSVPCVPAPFSTLNALAPIAPAPVGAAVSVTLTLVTVEPVVTDVGVEPANQLNVPENGKLNVLAPPLPITLMAPFLIYTLDAPKVEEAPPYPFQVNFNVLPPRSNTLPGVFKLATMVNGAEPNKVRSLVKGPQPLPLPFNASVLIFLLAGIDASSGFTLAEVAGAKKLNVKLYNPIRAVGALATVVNVPPNAPPDVVPIPKVGVATYP